MKNSACTSPCLSIYSISAARKTGLIVTSGDVVQLADRILYLLHNPAVGQQLGQAGQQVVMERFDFGVLARRLEEFYQGVLERGTLSNAADRESVL